MAEILPWKNIPAGALLSTQDPLVAEAAELLNRLERLDSEGSDDSGWLDMPWGHLQRRVQQQARRPALGDLLALSAVVTSVALLAFVLVRSHRKGNARPQALAQVQAQPAPTTRSQARPQQASATSAASGPVEPWAGWPRVELGANGMLWVQPGTTMRLPDSPTERSHNPRVGYMVWLDRGSLCAEVAARKIGSEGPFSVGTPHLEVTVIGTHFCVEATTDASSVSVQRGRVRVARGEESSLVLAAGESIRSDSARFNVSGLHVRSPRIRSTPPGPSVPPEAVGSLGRENDLYQRALEERRQQHHARAAGLLGDYLRSYPAGLFAPEVSFELAGELALAGRHAEALDAARRKLRMFPDAAHDGELELLMAGLLREQLARPADAMPIYEGLLNQSTNGEWRAEALFGRGACKRGLGDVAGAKASWMQYLAEYPGGSRVPQIRRLLGE